MWRLRVAGHEPGLSLRLEANPSWWGGPIENKNLLITVVPDEAAALMPSDQVARRSRQSSVRPPKMR